MAVLHVAIEGKPFEEGFTQTLPKTINFAPLTGNTPETKNVSLLGGVPCQGAKFY